MTLWCAERTQRSWRQSNSTTNPTSRAAAAPRTRRRTKPLQMQAFASYDGTSKPYPMNLGRHPGTEAAQRGLTPRSSGAPTAGHQARSGGTRYIFASPGLASRRRLPLSSNVRAHKPHEPIPLQRTRSMRPRRAQRRHAHTTSKHFPRQAIVATDGKIPNREAACNPLRP